MPRIKKQKRLIFHHKLADLQRNLFKPHAIARQNFTMIKIYCQLPLLCGHWCLKILWDKLGENQPSLAHVDREVILREKL